MITEMTRDQVIELGVRHKAGALLEQAGYTLGLARLDGDDLVSLMDDGYLDDFAKAIDAVHDALKDRTVAAEEAKGSTQAVNKAVLDAKLWRRRVNYRAEQAAKMGRSIPDGLLRAAGVKGVPGVAVQLDKMVKLLEANSKLLPGGAAGVKALIDKGKALADQLKAVDTTQELKKLKDYPDKVREFYYQKGLVFTGIKVINSAGRELHAHDPSAAARYSLSILNRHAGKKKAAAAKE